MQRTLVNESTHKVGETIVLKGWVDTKRDHGKLTFIDLRDRSGKVQCVGYQKMGELSTESVIEIVGLVKARPEKMINPEMSTGTVEVDVQEYTVLNKAVELPLGVGTDGREISEEVRLRYRYLDLRRERMQKNIRLRSAFTEAISQAFYKRDFVNIETPILTKSTKEGSRDFIVPSRFQPGKFYALPQSPQQYKQLLMTSGFERYFQLARCFRDEDLRADRGFELTQVDVEMSFVERQDVMDTMEEIVKEAVQKVGGKLKDEQFPVIGYKEAMEKYGADRFDLRTEEDKKEGKLAFAWVIDFPFFKKVDKDDAAEVRDGKSGWTFTHNPFSTPIPEHLEWHMKGERIEEIVTAQYDLICNGYEVGGGSIRAHDPAVLLKTFQIMGYSEAEVEASVGHMLEAFRVGTPPHGGIALGLDRMIMVLSGEDSMKESVAFPMTSTGRTSVMDAPSEITEEQLSEASLQVKGKGSPHDKILQLLQSSQVSYKYLSHEPVFTSEEAAAIRKDGSLHQGAKALVVEAEKKYVMVVLPGDMKADLDKVAQVLQVNKVKLASKEKVKELTGLEVGSIPPFGSVLGLKTYLDQRLSDNKEIVFNCARHDRSVMMKYEDYVKVEKPTII